MGIGRVAVYWGGKDVTNIVERCSRLRQGP